MNITESDLVDLMAEISRSTFCSLEYFAPITFAIKTGNPYIGACVSARYLVGLNWSYEMCVERARKRHKVIGLKPFKAGERSWGAHLMDGERITCMIEHKEMFYLHGILVSVSRRKWSFGGKAIAKSLLLPYLKTQAPVAKSQGMKQEWACLLYTSDAADE